MDSKIYIILNRVYKYFKLSLYFWLYLFRGIIVYSLIPCGCSLFAVVEELKQDKGHDGIMSLFSSYYREYSLYKMQSLIASFIIISIYLLLFFLNKANNEISLILTMLCIYLLAMIILVLTYTINYLVFQKYTFKMSLMHSFVFTLKNIAISISVLIAFIILFMLGKKNLVFLIFFTPFLYGVWVRMLLGKVMVLKEDK